MSAPVASSSSNTGILDSDSAKCSICSQPATYYSNNNMKDCYRCTKCFIKTIAANKDLFLPHCQRKAVECQGCSLEATLKITGLLGDVYCCTSCFSKVLVATHVESTGTHQCVHDGVHETPPLCDPCLTAQFFKNLSINIIPSSTTTVTHESTASSSPLCQACAVHPAVHTFKGALYHCDLCRAKLILENLPPCSLCGNATKNKATHTLDNKPYCCADCLTESTK